MATSVRSNLGVGESHDSEDSERLQRQCEDLTDQDYDPFHHKCGEYIVFRTKRRLVATHRSDIVGGGMVFSSKPIPIGTMFQVKLLEKENRGGPLVSACME